METNPAYETIGANVFQKEEGNYIDGGVGKVLTMECLK
jgi:hypothetical protein